MSEKKKIFPKLKKKLENFLADESGEITKKDALGLTAGAVVLGGIESANAGSTYSRTFSPSLDHLYPSNSEAYRTPDHINSVSRNFVLMDGGTCSHVSGVVNGHVSQVPSVNPSYPRYTATTTHNSHSSHSSHGNGGWC